MNTNRILATASAFAALGSASAAVAAEAPAVSAQKTSASAVAPVTIPGTGVKKGERLPAGARIVYRDVTLDRGQKTRLTLRAPRGMRLRGLATREGDRVGFATVDGSNYVGKRSVRVRAWAASTSDGERTGRIYALVRR